MPEIVDRSPWMPITLLGAGFLDLVDLARADVNALDPGGEEAFDDHLADAAAPARDERNAPLEAEQVFKRHHVSPAQYPLSSATRPAW